MPKKEDLRRCAEEKEHVARPRRRGIEPTPTGMVVALDKPHYLRDVLVPFHIKKFVLAPLFDFLLLLLWIWIFLVAIFLFVISYKGVRSLSSL